MPRTVSVGLSVASWAFALGAVAWLIARIVVLLGRSPPAAVEPLYAWTVDAALVIAAALCAWRPMPGTRSHVFARLAIVGWLIAVIAEGWPSHTVTQYDSCGLAVAVVRDAPGLIAAAASGRLILLLSLAGVALASGRRFALPRWMPVVAAGVSASLAEAGLAEFVSGFRADSSLVIFPVHTVALPELLMLVAFSAAFATAARAARRRPFLDEDAILSRTAPRAASSASDARAYPYWRASISAVVACLFALASIAGAELALLPGLEGWPSSRPIAAALGLVVFLALIERARRKHAASSSLALTAGAGAAALCGVASVFATFASTIVFRSIGLVTTAITLGGIALFLPTISALPTVVAKVKSALYLGALFLALSAGAELRSAASFRSAAATPEPWIGGEVLLLLAAVSFVTIAVHLARSIERAALIAEALAREESLAGDDDASRLT
ncbi:MAG: hypothetical protein KF764_04985 [Labilithrix sp.]|nr:hypothetical protein [Labilithrix sp.]